MKKLAIAIDGPAGAGKSTVAKMAAKQLGYVYIDTGAMYRAVTYKAMQQAAGSELTTELVCKQLDDIEIRLAYQKDLLAVYLNDEDVSVQIRTPEVSKNVSFVAQIPAVRQKLVMLQRQMAQQGGVVMDGRDICTHVLPNADVKLFLTASIEERAGRRFKELLAKGYKVELKTLEAEIAARDKADSEREISPLVQAPDADLLDTTSMTINEVVEKIISYCGSDVNAE